MDSDNDEVTRLLVVLAEKIHSCQGILSAQEVANALYGLKNMSCDRKEVRDLLDALSKHVEQCQESFTAQNIGCACFVFNLA